MKPLIYKENGITITISLHENMINITVPDGDNITIPVAELKTLSRLTLQAREDITHLVIEELKRKQTHNEGS